MKGAQDEFLYLCNYTLVIQALGPSLPTALNQTLTEEQKVRAGQIDLPTKEDVQKTADCAYPERVSGMEQCCSAAGVSSTCTACNRDYFRALVLD